jgi:transglutaminase-like putative cysteine protease
MRYRITHESVYTYSSDVSVSHHVVRLTPRELPTQHGLAHQLTLEPGASTRSSRTDYFGNETSVFTVVGVHRRLKLTAISQVDLSPNPTPVDGPSWEAARDSLAGATAWAEIAAQQFIYPSYHIPNLPASREYAAGSFRPGRSLLEAVVELSGRIHRDFKFDTRATTVATPLEQVWKNRRGVCQDFAHLHIACVRAFRLPARYVSGYLETLPPPGEQKLAGADASHAWVQVFVPPNGWVNIDPTNDLLPSQRHIVLAWGRDFDDVSPVRGVIVGGGKHTLTVGVDVTPFIQS